MADFFNHPFVVLMQLGQTKRYHTELLHHPQDVAQHSYNMAWLLWRMTEGQASSRLLMAALAHDGAERWMGDVPSPTKRLLDPTGNMDAAERKLVYEKVGFTPELTAEEATFLDLADQLEGLLFCWRELQFGNQWIRRCLTNYTERVEELLRTTPIAAAFLSYNTCRILYELAQFVKELKHDQQPQ